MKHTDIVIINVLSKKSDDTIEGLRGQDIEGIKHGYTEVQESCCCLCAVALLRGPALDLICIA